MNKVIVGVADMAIANEKDKVVVTYALGSCIGITLYDQVAGVGGLLHYMLPDSKINPQKSRERPFMFADTAIPLFFKTAYEYGAKKERMIVKIMGGANVLNDKSNFEIGKRNGIIARKMLWKNNVMIKAQEIGGNISRTVELYIDSGKVIIKTPNKEERVI